MLNLIFILYFVALLLLFVGIYKWMTKKKTLVNERMDYIAHLAIEENGDVDIDFGKRVVLPLFNHLGQRILALSPERSQKRKRMVLERAGFLKNISYERFVARQWLMQVVVILGLFIVLFLLGVEMSILIVIVLWMWVMLLGGIRFYTQKAIELRKNQMVKDLPYALDLITVSVEAGLSLDGAIARIVANIQGVLSEEFMKTLKEIRMGIEKKQALKNMGERCDVKDISVLMTSLIQADELGVSLGKVLRIEGAQLREKRRQAAREKAMKAPVKILFPLVFFIFPSVFIVILGPAVLLMMTRL